ncbi:HAMP domain-containing sensor histidine kinase [Halarcobacter sp.]|uniref:sensor histidine kinase n=1 Tax=Halarcobacter sp. TaxID=2321133 RepID=UPI002AA68A14|nr:HAMP domain-containing sensor histidine kinase [Halarcobacter sp.]
MVLIALLYYQNEKKLYFDLAKTKMRNVVSNISSQIIFAHMSGNSLDMNQFLKTDLYQISFYDKNKKLLFGNLKDKDIDFSKNIIMQKENFILIDKSTYGHLDIYYIAIKENLFFNRLTSLQKEIVFLFFIIYFFISLIGFFLARLFLKPIKDERDRLNNFIKDTTHELNTPISAILMSSEDEENLTPKQVKRIKLAAQRISEVYKDLTFIFLENKQNLTVAKEFNLKKLIESQLKYFEALALKKRITINSELRDTFFTIDENDFIRLFNNILSNAIKYNKQKGTITILLENNTLTIKDSGIGIEKSKLKDIFNRYYRATDFSGGFGIGLNIVQNICEKYKIKIDINSELDIGSCFTLKF